MFQPVDPVHRLTAAPPDPLSRARWRSRLGPRAIAILFALAVEVLLLLVLLGLAPPLVPPKLVPMATFTIDTTPDATPDASEAAQAEPKAESPASAPPAATPPPSPIPETQSPPMPATQPSVAPAPVTPPPPIILLPRDQMAAADISRAPAAPPAAGPPAPRRVYGPPDNRPPSNDTPRVAGSGPNGEPLYAASWYREPYDDELSGYLSTAKGPGWGMIACRTVPEYRVEDCYALGEGPEGSNIARAVLAAAWQFRVRPPRLGGRLKYGEWVAIRIDYTSRRGLK